MIDFANTVVTNCIIHNIGNKVLDEKIELSDSELELDDNLANQIGLYFQKPFKSEAETFQFFHGIDIKLNPVFMTVDEIFEGNSFTENSINIAKHLYQQTRHPAIKSGELFIALFDEVVYEDVVCKAIGIFKSEKKDNFFKVNKNNSRLELQIDSGINQQKIDKACLILNDAYHEGYTVFTYEQNNADTEYWRSDFLSIRPKEDSYYKTTSFLNICKEYVKDTLPSQFEVSRADQVDYLNKSVDFFKTTTDFKVENFVKEVFQEPGIMKSFKNFKNSYEENGGVEIPDEFSINFDAVKKQSKHFKSVIKLDRNFHVYLHGDRKMIEQGYDEEKGLKFYKIYYQEES